MEFQKDKYKRKGSPIGVNIQDNTPDSKKGEFLKNDPNRNSIELLVEESKITIPGAQDEVFNNRYRVLVKMNRLSNILLAKQKKRTTPNKRENSFITKTYNRDNSYNPNSRKHFNRHILARSSIDRGTRRATSRSPGHKFLNISLAMISSKGPSCEDRPILRRMRLEKGGVVDLAQGDRKKNKFKIKKAERKQSRRSLYTDPKYRDKAAKVIQAWWRDRKTIYNDTLKKIIQIQSVFRGRFTRKYMYDLFYLNSSYISFCKKIESVLSNHVLSYVMDNLFGKKEPGTYDYLEKENKKLVSELSNSTKKIEQLNNTIVQLNNKINALTNKNNEYEKLIKRLTDENKNLVKKNKNKDKDNNFGDIKKGNEQKDELLLSLAKQIEIKDNEINRLNKEINKYKSIIPFEIKEGEELLPVIFYSTDKKLHYSFICKNTEKFGELEIRLYELYPQYEEYENCFYVNGNKIKRTKSLKENKIKYSDSIMVHPIND